jgi:uncharacterized protein YggE
MRLVIAAALALAGTCTSAGAAQPVAEVELQPGESLLEVDAVGQARTAADLVTVHIPVEGKGATTGEARRVSEAAAERLVAAAKSAGIRASDVERTSGPSALGFVGNEAFDEGAAGWSVLASQMSRGEKTVVSGVKLRLRDPSRFVAVRAALEKAGAENVPGPVYSLTDDSEARRLARADAIKAARVEAEQYATAVGMRLGRLLRVSERSPGDAARLATEQQLLRLMTGASGEREGQITTKVVVGVDYALVPR